MKWILMIVAVGCLAGCSMMEKINDSISDTAFPIGSESFDELPAGTGEPIPRHIVDRWVAEHRAAGHDTSELENTVRLVFDRRSPASEQDPDWRLHMLFDALASSGIKTTVTFVATGGENARIRYRRWHETGPGTASSQLTNNATATVGIGVYNIWAERDGVRTSDDQIRFRIEPDTETVELDEGSVFRTPMQKTD